MLVDLDSLDAAYEAIRKQAFQRHTTCPVVVFVAPDVDALCSCRILEVRAFFAHVFVVLRSNKTRHRMFYARIT